MLQRTAAFHASARMLSARMLGSLTPWWEVIPIPVREDNYTYILVDQANMHGHIIDPGFSAHENDAFKTIMDKFHSDGIEFLSILLTHHHSDHISGVPFLVDYLKHDVCVFGPQEVKKTLAEVTHVMADGDEIKGDDTGQLNVKVIGTPCHTKNHVCYLVQGNDESPPLLFSGDTLFVGGCGRFFEGSAKDMLTSFRKLKAEVPTDALVYCGHEYTLSNLDFALKLEEDITVSGVVDRGINIDLPGVVPKIKESFQLLDNRGMTIPSVFGDERKYNPFFLQAYNEEDEDDVVVERLATLREAKDNYRSRNREEMEQVIGMRS